MIETTQQQDLLRGIWRENPVLIQMLGLCPALAVTNNVENSLAMGLATLFVLCGAKGLKTAPPIRFTGFDAPAPPQILRAAAQNA